MSLCPVALQNKQKADIYYTHCISQFTFRIESIETISLALVGWMNDATPLIRKWHNILSVSLGKREKIGNRYMGTSIWNELINKIVSE